MTRPNMRAKPSRLCYRAVEFRAAPTGQTDGRTLEGYAAVFDAPTEIDSYEGCFSEIIARGAFKRTLNARMPVLQFDHGRDARTGSVPIGAIQTLSEDKTGLFVSARMFDNDVVEPIRQAIEAQAIDGMSFRFRVVRDSWVDGKGQPIEGTELYDLLWQPGDRGPITRTIQEVELFELGPVVFPAYESTSVGVRSMLATLDDESRSHLMRELVGMLRDEPERAAEPPEPPPVTTEPTEAPREREGLSRTPSEPAETGTPDRSETQEPVKPDTSRIPPNAVQERTTTMPDQMTVEERASRQREIRSRLNEIDGEHAGATLPDETQTEWDSLNREYDQHTEAIRAQEARRESLLRFAEEHSDGLEGGIGGRPPRTTERDRSRGPAVHVQRDIYDLAELRQRARSVDEMAGLYRENALRAVEQAVFPGSESREKAQTTVERVLATHDDKDGTLARRLLVTGSPIYSRAFGKMCIALSDRGLSSEERAALAVGVDSTGGFAVPFQLDPTIILTSNGVINPLRSISRVERIVGKEWQGVTSAGVTVTRAAEGDEAGDNSPTLAQPTVKAERVQGFIPFSVEAQQDWNQLQSEMNRLLADAKDVEEAGSFVTGDGTGTNAGGVVATLPSGSQVTVSTAAGGFTVPDTLDAITEALPPRFRARAQWLANISIYNKIGALAAAAGYQLDPWVSLVDSKPRGLIGYMKNEASEMTTDISTAGKLYLLFGDFSQFLIVDQLGMSVELVPHLFGSNGRPTGQRGIYAIWRNNSVVLVPGAFRVAKAAA